MNSKNSSWDVIVLGGGVSGCMAAIASARQGAKTLLVEQYGFLGGSLTNAGVGPMMTFHAGARQVVTGIPQELVDRMTALGGCLGHIEDSTGYASSVTPFDEEIMKVALDQLTAESGVTVLFHGRLVSVRSCGDALSAVTIQTRGGLLELEAKVFIDASGDGALSFAAGAQVCQGRDLDGFCQPMTTNMKIRGINIAALKKEVRRDPENFNIRDLSAMDRSPRLSVAGFYRQFRAAKERGELTTAREDVLLFETVVPGEMIVNTTRVVLLNPTNPWDLSRAEQMGRQQAQELIQFFRTHCAGMENAELISTGVQIGVRESRRVVGDYVLTAEDLLSSRHFDDTVALGGYPIDIHNPTGEKTETTHLKPGQFYYLPLRALIAAGKENLLVCGRCLSATHEAGAAIRVTPIAMAVGQAAGTAAGLAAVEKVPVRALDITVVQNAIVKLGGTVS